jgi:hypothetical protein
MIKGLLRITYFSVALFVLQYLISMVISPAYYYVNLPWMLLFYWIQFMGLHALSVFIEENFNMDHSLILLAGVSARLIIAMMAMVLTILVGVESKEMFVINFSIVYLLYLVFEITTVCSNLRSNLK